MPQDNTDKDAAEKKPFYMAAKTNLLYDAALVPNVGLEFYLGKGWSVCGDWMYAWWSKDAKHRYCTAASWKCASTSVAMLPKNRCRDTTSACTRRG